MWSPYNRTLILFFRSFEYLLYFGSFNLYIYMTFLFVSASIFWMLWFLFSFSFVVLFSRWKIVTACNAASVHITLRASNAKMKNLSHVYLFICLDLKKKKECKWAAVTARQAVNKKSESNRKSSLKFSINQMKHWFSRITKRKVNLCDSYLYSDKLCGAKEKKMEKSFTALSRRTLSIFNHHISKLCSADFSSHSLTKAKFWT